VASVLDRTIPGPAGPMVIRIYSPKRTAGGSAIVFYHGGGWVLGSLDSHDGLCRRLANVCLATVISVDYRLAPEHRFPAAIDDCDAATRWVFANARELTIDAAKIAVCGDSAGGNLAAAVTLRLRKSHKIAAQALLYPITDFSYDRPSYRENAEGYFLTRGTMEWFWNHYLARPEDGAAIDALPLRADLKGLPPAYVMTAGYDPLRDEGRAYAQKLIEAGVNTTFVEYPGMVHGFLRRVDRFPRATPAIEDVGRFLAGNLPYSV
jgi:acetyl esterase